MSLENGDRDTLLVHVLDHALVEARDTMFCGVDCDGGGVFVKLRNADQMLVDLERKGTIAMSYSCGEEEGFPLQSGRDDKTFLLTRMLPQFCMPPQW
jgi:hypothetical protein